MRRYQFWRQLLIALFLCIVSFWIGLKFQQAPSSSPVQPPPPPPLTQLPAALPTMLESSSSGTPLNNDRNRSPASVQSPGNESENTKTDAIDDNQQDKLNAFDGTPTSLHRIKLKRSRWDAYVASCQSTAHLSPSRPPTYIDSGGSYANSLVCYHQARVFDSDPTDRSIYDRALPLDADMFLENIDEVIDGYWNASWGMSGKQNFVNSEKRRLVLHDPNVTALTLSAPFIRLNYYHLLMDAMVPAAEWLATAARFDAPSHGANRVEVVIIGNQRELDAFRKPRIVGSLQLAGLLSSDRQTVILAEGTDQRAHCFCQHANFAINNLPKFGVRRQRGIRYINQLIRQEWNIDQHQQQHHDKKEEHRGSVGNTAVLSPSEVIHPLDNHHHNNIHSTRHHGHLTERQLICRRMAKYQQNVNTSSVGITSPIGIGIRLLYLTRLNRKPENEKAFLHLAQQMGMTVVSIDLAGLSAREQLRWVRWADVILGSHGMQLTYVAHTIPTFRGDYEPPEFRLVTTNNNSINNEGHQIIEIGKVLEDDAEWQVAQQSCRTYVELMHFVWPEWILFYVELAQLSGVTFERVVPVSVQFGPKVGNPAREEQLLMTPKVFYWKMAGFQDQRVQYDLKRFEEIFSEAIGRWKACCR